MKPSEPTLWQRVREAFSGRLVLGQIVLAVVVLLLLALWLQVPDASALDVAGSVVLGLVLLVAACGGEALLVLWLGGRPWTRGRLLAGGGLLLVAGLLWWGFASWMGHLDSKSYLYASYANSKLPHGLRYALPYGRLLATLHWWWTTIAWLAGGLLAVFVFAVLLSDGATRAAIRVLASPVFWVVLVLAVDAGVYGSAALLHWVPGRALGVEFASLVLRLLAVLLLDSVLVCLVFCLVLALMRRAGLVYPVIPRGTPELSQPRTVEKP